MQKKKEYKQNLNIYCLVELAIYKAINYKNKKKDEKNSIKLTYNENILKNIKNYHSIDLNIKIRIF
jgi:hypothetical protein